MSTMRDEVRRRNILTPIDAEPIVLRAKQRTKTQPPLRCACGVWTSIYRRQGDTLCLSCQRSRSPHRRS